ncbi:MAG: helicase [Gammaproteobacteria bacterium]|nr:helicase [Gammaproteobacteria bacterium]
MVVKDRRYFRSSIVELEQLFESSKEDRTLLNDLCDELKHRNTNRANVLARKIEERLSAASQTSALDLPFASKDNIAFPEQRSAISDEGVLVETFLATTLEKRSPSSSSFVMNGTDSADSSCVSDVVPLRQERIEAGEVVAIFDDDGPQFAPEVEILPGPDSVLAAWLTLEVLALQPIPDARETESIGRQLVKLKECPEPWREPRFGKRGKERAVYWMVYLGELDLAKAAEAFLKLYPDAAVDERADISGNTTLAVIVVDSYGRPVESKTFLSSFAWGYGQVRAGHLKGLAGFVDAERVIKAKLERGLVRQSDDGKILPLTGAHIDQAITWLVKVLNLSEAEIMRPGVAIRVPQWGGYQEAPEPELLNSFFIEDLVKARAAFRGGQVGQALSAYMGATASRERQDVIRDRGIVAKTLAPRRMPLARWPGPGRHPLVLMQQAAINHAITELANGGIVSVNGPPGTGKTTLLRDIVAKVVLDRAVVMSKFDNPLQAFSHVTKMRTGQAYTHLYQLDQRLIGHEIVVASSNNKAVENISREIPSTAAIANDLNPPAQYFRSIADVVAAGKGAITEGATWGLAAAVLGNSANRSAFAQAFWWHKRRGMALYLKAVMGGDIPEDEDDEEEGDEQNILDVVAIERPPRSEIEALENWRIARRSFLAKYKNVEALQKQAQSAHEAMCQRPAAAQRLDDSTRALTDAKRNLVSAQQNEENCKHLHERASEAARIAQMNLDSADRLRPGFFARLFGTRSYREWQGRMTTALEALNQAGVQLKTSFEGTQKAAGETQSANKKADGLELEKNKAESALAQIVSTIDEFRKKADFNFADEAFWAQEDHSLQLQSPWVFDELQQARDSLFLETFSLHRAFIDAAAKPLRNNLRAALDVMKGRVLKENQEPTRKSLWASLFLVVPVISTTFASVARLFGPLDKEQLGWLLIDEAGQAVPQAAIGALWRAKRAVVIGDPLQIQPVVTVPPKLIRSIFAEFGVEAEEWAAPDMSAQTLADRVSWFGTNILNDDGEIWVGSPLRVHRRCENPMFKISNHIAYDGKMVYGTPVDSSQIGEILGESSWINVNGGSDGKWSEAEGQQVLKLLGKLLDRGIKEPDIFVITPFRIVAKKIREMIRSNRSISERLPTTAWEWTNKRVGTVHTFQGKEAEAVVLVLGASHEASAGARNWAGHPPNLLNVAVTRAKRRLYVVGNKEAWRNAGTFSHLAQILPVQRPSANGDRARE